MHTAAQVRSAYRTTSSPRQLSADRLCRALKCLDTILVATVVRISPQRHLHENIGTTIGHWRKVLRFHVARANRFIQVNSILEARIAAEEQRSGAALLACAIACSSKRLPRPLPRR